MTMLELQGVQTSYGRSQVLFGISLSIGEGQVATLIGRNGMGKTTTVRSIMGLTPAHSGSIKFKNNEIRGAKPYEIAQMGIGLVPEGRRIFPNLNVEENLVATAANRTGAASPWTLEKVFELFPRLNERRRNMGSQLSGGEQQMLAIARALMTNPALLILDEATEGLAPVIRAEIWSVLSALKRKGQSILLIDKNLREMTAVADYHFVIEKGVIVWAGDNASLLNKPDIQHKYLGI